MIDRPRFVLIWHNSQQIHPSRHRNEAPTLNPKRRSTVLPTCFIAVMRSPPGPSMGKETDKGLEILGPNVSGSRPSEKRILMAHNWGLSPWSLEPCWTMMRVTNGRSSPCAPPKSIIEMGMFWL